MHKSKTDLQDWLWNVFIAPYFPIQRLFFKQQPAQTFNRLLLKRAVWSGTALIAQISCLNIYN